MRATASALEVAARIIRDNADNPHTALQLLDERLRNSELHMTEPNTYASNFNHALYQCHRLLRRAILNHPTKGDF